MIYFILAPFAILALAAIAVAIILLSERDDD